MSDDRDLVAAFMRALAVQAGDPQPLPDPHGILRRAHLRERLEAEQRATDRVAQPILTAGLLGPFGVALVLATLPRSGSLTVLAAVGLFTALAAGLGIRLALIED